MTPPVTTIETFIARLRDLGVALSVQGEELRCRAPKGTLTPTLAGEISARKPEILDFLRRAQALATPLDDIIGPAPADQPPPLSFGQQRLWFLDRLEPGAATYTMPMAVRLDGALDTPSLQQALNALVQRHAVLRTNFVLRDGQPALLIHETAECPLSIRTLPDGMAPAAAQEMLVAAEAGRHFDLAGDRLLQATLVPLPDGGHLFLLTMHHIVSDGWSLDLIMRELAALYGAFRQGLPSPLPPLPLHYVDFAHWQRQRLQGAFLAGELAHWRGRLAGAPDMLALPTDRPRPPIQTYRGASLDGVLDADLTRHLRDLGQSAGTTLYMTLLAGFALLLSRYAGQQDVLVGSPVAGRTRAELEGLVGLFINTLVLRLDLSGNPSTHVLLDRVRRTALEALDHQELPFEQLVEELRPARTLSHAPLVQVSFQLRAPSMRTEVAGLTLIPVPQQETTAKFDLSLTVEEQAADLILCWNYNPDLFDEDTIRRAQGHYRTVLEGMVSAPDRPLSQISMMGPAELRAIQQAARGPQTAGTGAHTLPDLFDRMATRCPDRVALSFAGSDLTYAALSRRIDDLAAHLQSLGVGPETLVALCVERSPDMVVALLAILKAGGAYIPLDPAYPRERLVQVVGHARPALVLTQRHLRDLFDEACCPVSCLDADWHPGNRRPVGGAEAGNIAYVIYTSGSTGRPKGVAVDQRALVNFLLSMQREPGFNEADALLAVTTISFDIAGLELYLPLISGGRLVLADRETALDGRALQAALSAHAITCMQATPATWRILVETGWQPARNFKALCGGEALPRALGRALLDRGASLWNLYGPTETTVWSAAAPVLPDPDGGEGVEPVGGPIANTCLHVLGPQAHPLPLGIAGELHIGGDGLARGYLHQPGLTADRYIPDPFSNGARLYRTGDQVRRLAGGRLEFLGRIDHQVKIRGFRIELGEIEAALRHHEGVCDAIVLAREDVPGDRRLVAYVVAAGAPAPAAADLRGFLRERLPAYMVPGAIMLLETFPLTPNGKADRKALPAPEQAPSSTTAPTTATTTAMEARVAAVWREVLRVEHIGADDNFFDLGGHSLLLPRVHEALQADAAQPFPLITLFQYPTVRTLAAWLAGEERPAAAPVAPPATMRPSRDIAIIGMAGRFPGADDLDTFWENLREGRESIRFFTRQELLDAGVPEPVISNPAYVPANGCLSDIAGFDAGFFGITPLDAEVMDPQHRLFLETAWHALENAGHAGRRGSRIGVFAGSSHAGYLARNLLPSLFAGIPIDVQRMIFTNDKDFLPTRTSYTLDLRGPSVSVQTACSTSLVVLHQACLSLLAGDCDMALAGAVAVKLPHIAGYTYREDAFPSPDGHCRAFDADANGTTWGSGVAVVLLKPLDRALADRDTIHAIIKGSAVNNDGAQKVSFTAPGIDAQAQVITAAQANAGLSPSDISYIEAHGTGTRLGDPIEVAALTQAFRTGTDAVQTCALGAVKPNIGHLDTAAGMAGLVKTVLALQHRQIPPTINFRRPNPQIDFAGSPFFVNDRLRDWVDNGRPRRAGVSSFGIGGTNAHLIVEEAPPRTPSASSRSHQLLVLSARSPAALEQQRAALAAYLAARPETALVDASYTLAVGRRAFACRFAIACRDGADAIRALTDPTRQAPPPPAIPPGIVFLFPGQGSQYAGMGAELYRTEPLFRATIDHGAERLGQRLGLDLRRLLYPAPADRDAADEQLSRTWLTQPALFLTEYALARLWMSWGLTPRSMIGHSLGEYVAACLSGVFDLDTALDIVAERGRLIWEQPEGAMLAVGRPAGEIGPFLTDGLGIAAINGTQECVISGPVPAVEALAARLTAEEIPCRRLRTSHAFHSAMLEPAARSFGTLLRSTRLSPPRLPFISNLTGTWITPEQATDPEYWVSHLLQPVRFAEGIATILADPGAIALEVGPGAVLGNLARRHPAVARDRIILSSLPRAAAAEDAGEIAGMQDSLGRLWMEGANIDWAAYHAADIATRIPLPGYPFQRQRYFIEEPDPSAVIVRQVSKSKPAPGGLFTLPAWKPALPLRLRGMDGFAAQDGTWLVFSDGSELAGRILSRLRDAGCAVVRVTSGTVYRQENDAFTIRPSEPGDYRALAAALQARPPCMVLHFWSLSVPKDAPFDQKQAAGYYSLLLLGRTLAAQYPGVAVRMAVFTRHLHDVGGNDPVDPDQATLIGPCLVMPQEMPDITCRCLDIGEVAPPVDMLLADLLDDIAEPMVAYRGSRRFLPDFVPVTLDPARQAAGDWHPGGVYLITGGLGRVGLMLARHLAETLKARLILVGPSPFPERESWDEWLDSHGPEDKNSLRIRQLRGIEALGAELLTIRADVADERQLRAAFARGQSRFGPVLGVIHAAGRLGDASYLCPVTEVGEAETRTQFRPKVQGLRVLEKVLAGTAVEFCLVISSASSVLGGFGFSAYAGAHAFVDAFVTAQSRLPGTRWLGVNCDIGVFEDQGGDEQDPAAPTIRMTRREAAEALMHIVTCVDSGRVILCPGNIGERYGQWVRQAGERKPLAPTAAPLPPPRHARPALATDYTAPGTMLETKLAALWETLFGFTLIGIHDNFFDLGGDSLLAIRHMTMVKESFGRRLPLAELMARPTIHALAQWLEQPDPDAFSPLIAIQPQGTGLPFFCMPGTGGSVLYLRALAESLKAQGRPFYGLQASGLDGATTPLDRIEDIAAENLRAIRAIQPTGPYLLGGHSFGSWVAFEMARQLLEAGETVAGVAVLDTGAPGPRTDLPQEGWDDTRWLLTIADILGTMFARPHGLRHEQLAGKTWDQQVEALTRALEAMGAVQAGTDAAEIRGFAEVYRAQAQIVYQPATSRRVPVALFKAGELLDDFLAGMPPDLRNDPYWGWTGYSDGPTLVETVPGNHLTMMTAPQVDQLAERLGAILSLFEQQRRDPETGNGA